MMAKKFDHNRIDDFLHTRIRLAIMTVLATVDEIDFVTLKNEVNTSDGNLSVHIKKLEDKKYITIEKKFVNRKPQTVCKISDTGLGALEDYYTTVTEFLKRE